MPTLDTKQQSTSGTRTFKNKEKEKDIDKEKPEKKKPKSSHKSPVDRLKTVVRRLPSNLPEDIFWQSVNPWVTDETVTWKVYYQGKLRKRMNKENIPSRAYIAFKDEKSLAIFSREYDGHLFRDKAGNESIAVVEFAPYQKVPSEKKKVDNRTGTIDKDEDYLSFLESLKDNPSKPFDIDSLEALAAAIQPPPPPTTTPLLEALKAEKSAQKDKETILRAHAHYKDPTIAASASVSKKEEGGGKGKRGAPANLPPKPSEPNISKKVAKAAKANQNQSTDHSASEPKANLKKILHPPNTSSTSTANNNNAGAQPQPSTSKTAPTKPPPKSPRRNRERERHEAKTVTAILVPAASGQPPSETATPPSAPAQPAHTATTGTSTTTTSATPAATPASVPRRSRPVLGLASRQFEAALSGAVVDRKAKRERENKEGSEQVPSGGTTATNNADSEPKSATPKTSQKDQTSRSTKEDGAHDGSSSTHKEGGGSGPRGRGRGRGGRGRGGNSGRGS